MLRLDYAAISDVGRVRKDNQDSAYAGPWLLAVCDGVGGAARGDIASATVVSELRDLDTQPDRDTSPQALLRLVNDGLARAHQRIADLVDDDPALNGTSTTASLGLFDGARMGIGHVGDSRAYLFRDGEISQLTRDHTFVQSLIDEGRITEDEARVHPHRNLILRAIDGIQDLEPDLFLLELTPGDRLLFCSDGITAVLDAGRLADVLSTGTPDYAAVELVRASLEAGTTDNVTCVVADAVDADAAAPDAERSAAADLQPMMVGAAAELRRRSRPAAGKSLFRGHRSGDTGELEPISAEVLDEAPQATPTDAIVDPESARYAPRPPRRFTWLSRLLVLAAVVGVVWVAAAGAWTWSQQQYFVGVDGDRVAIFRGLNASLPGVDLHSEWATTNVELGRLSEFEADRVREGIDASSRDDAERIVEDLAAKMSVEEPA
ncbi:PP2C family serine/threonine-protein phosphatase [Nocardioides sp. SYSU D00038]|uniref:PP2C family protein-serine/threonine phosphatase n=1 Tax=Nocardioides sp. SYSU D00038 TaxID=2812554 RepID=UPI00196706D5|nr:protein phosphatase 2C domain-containing protein [Nocardioides sp. SYSU D00038]